VPFEQYCVEVLFSAVQPTVPPLDEDELLPLPELEELPLLDELEPIEELETPLELLDDRITPPLLELLKDDELLILLILEEDIFVPESLLCSPPPPSPSSSPPQPLNVNAKATANIAANVILTLFIYTSVVCGLFVVGADLCVCPCAMRGCPFC
jgi:hypothetical protein